MGLIQIWSALVRIGRGRALLLQVVLIGTLVALSLVPGNERPHTGLPGKLEHVIAYWGAGLILAGIALTRARRLGWAPALVVLAGVLEYLQVYVPGRTSEVSDWMASSTGAILGVGAALAMARWSEAEPPGPPAPTKEQVAPEAG